MKTLKIVGMALALVVMSLSIGHAFDENRQDDEQIENDVTPPRLSLADGNVSFLRSGGDEWEEALVNTPLAPGDKLYTGESSNLELQIGTLSFVRAAENTQIGLDNLESQFIQFRVTTGTFSLDIRELEPGRTIEVDAPNAAILIDHDGYYRVNVDGDHTSVVARRSGQARITLAGGAAFDVFSDEEASIDGTTSPQFDTYRAPGLDRWDRWGLSRTDQYRQSASTRYVSSGVYGLSDLERAGEWRESSEYGEVWTPSDVPEDWAPYSTGSWIDDPVYGMTWVDTAPWGWAPYHYGRWVMLNGRWAWAPGPPIRRPAYAPALVAFLGDGGDSTIGWVALGWGEPLMPWWGQHRHHGPWWGGWGGPRFAESEHSGRYRNMGSSHAVVMVNRRNFGHGPIRPLHEAGVLHGLRPFQGNITVTGASLGSKRGIRPPEAVLQRSVIATRPARHEKVLSTDSHPESAGRHLSSPARIVPMPTMENTNRPHRQLSTEQEKQRDFHSTGQRPEAERMQPLKIKTMPATPEGASMPPRREEQRFGHEPSMSERPEHRPQPPDGSPSPNDRQYQQHRQQSVRSYDRPEVHEPQQPNGMLMQEPRRAPQQQQLPVERTMERPVQQRTMERPVERTMERPVQQRTMERPVERTMERPVERTMERPVQQRTMERPVERTMERPVQQHPAPMVVPSRPPQEMHQREQSAGPHKPEANRMDRNKREPSSEATPGN